MPVKSFDPQALTSLTQEAARDAERRYGFDPQALTSLTLYLGKVDTYGRRFDPQALTSLTLHLSCTYYTLQQFRSTGSYEPDRVPSNSSIYLKSFDPQALTSLTETGIRWNKVRNGFDPQALTSLTVFIESRKCTDVPFRSTGSYEPDRGLHSDGKRN